MRNKLLIVVALATLAVPAARAQSKNSSKDTVVVRSDTVVFSHSESGRTRLSNKGNTILDFDLPFYRKIRPRSSQQCELSLGAGLLYTDSKSPLDFNPQNSIEYEIYLLDTHTKGHSTLSYGLGCTFRNYSLTGNNLMTLDDDGRILTGPFPAGSVPKVSKLRVFSVNVPLLYSFSFADGFGVTLGPVVNVNARSSVVNKYKVDKKPMKDKYTQPRCNLVTVDARLQLNLKYFSLYAKYSPMSVMDKGYCPEFQTWSFGVVLF